MSTARMNALEQLFEFARQTEQAALCQLPDGLHLKVVLRGERRFVAAWVDHPHRLNPQACEEIGEDAGFFEPLVTPWECAESKKARLIVEGYQGQLCEHTWNLGTHFDARDEFGEIRRCQRCGVVRTCTQARRGRRTAFGYDVWDLREHIYRRWAKRGPVPGALQAQAHHKVPA